MSNSRGHSRAFTLAKFRAFTLAELLAVIGVIAILAVVVSMSAQRISKDAKLAGATNLVLASLAQGRAIAIRDHAMVLVAFRVRQPTIRQSDGTELPDPSKQQQTEIVIAKATGRIGFPGAATNGNWSLIFPAQSINDLLIEVFEPVEGLPPKLLPTGVKVAGSACDVGAIGGIGQDELWLSQPQLKNFERASLVVVRFAPDGTTLTRNPHLTANLTPTTSTDTSVVAPWIDFNRDGKIAVGATSSTSNGLYFAYDELGDEPLGDHTLFLAIFNDDNFHEQGNPLDWQGYGSWMTLNTDRTAFINQFADRIHFNRFTGVAEVVPK